LPERFRYSDLKEAVWHSAAMGFGWGTESPGEEGNCGGSDFPRESAVRRGKSVAGGALLRARWLIDGHTSGSRAGARRMPEMRKIESWAWSGSHRGRTESCLTGSEPLQQDHGAATSRAEPQGSRGSRDRCRSACGRRVIYGGEQLAAQWQQGGAAPVGKEPEMRGCAPTREAARAAESGAGIPRPPGSSSASCFCGPSRASER
jgi:hypothetical protein